jgi:hypothetical protein
VLIGPDEAAQDVQQGCLACPVRPDDTDNLAGRNGKRHVIEGLQAAEAHANAANLKD